MGTRGGSAGRRLGIATALLLLCAAAPPPLSFVAVEPRSRPSADLYESRWRDEGDAMVAALEAAAGIAFPPEPIEVIVRDGPPMTSFDGRTIRLRAGYAEDGWRAAMMHELGHRLAQRLGRAPGIDDHRALYLFLYDALADLYGRDFADRTVRVERGFVDAYDYSAAWRWALAMSRDQRRALLGRLRPR
jgi:hypothetical protein